MRASVRATMCSPTTEIKIGMCTSIMIQNAPVARRSSDSLRVRHFMGQEYILRDFSRRLSPPEGVQVSFRGHADFRRIETS